MKRKIFTLIMAACLSVSLVGCNGDRVTVENNKTTDNTSMFVEVERGESWRVVYHKETKVMYVISLWNYNRGNFTVMVDADGKPLLWEE